MTSYVASCTLVAIQRAIQKADVPLIVMSVMLQVRVGVIGQAMKLVGDHTYFRAIQE